MNYNYRKPLPNYKLGGANIDFFDTRSAIEDISTGAYAKLPYTSRVLAEQLVRRCKPETLTDSLKQIIEKGDVIGILRNPFGDILKTYTSPENGIVIGKSTNPINMSGGRIIHLGILAKN